MLFNSSEFAVFFVVVYSLYLFLDHRWQNRLLLLASYVFYGAWSKKYLILIWMSTLLDYVCGHAIAKAEKPSVRKAWLSLSILGNLGILGVFKYFNFFAENAALLLQGLGLHVEPVVLHVALPVGISFYTFQTMSYTIDIYQGRLQPAKSLPDFALFVAFFPQLVAGPIERARNLLPQVIGERRFSWDQFYEGCFLFTWGLYQKVFIADNLAGLVQRTFQSSGPYQGFDVLISLYAFAFQILCDFAGYSNMARGLAKVLGFEIMINFKLPYFASNPQEFWRRWHISLSTWIRDYLYIPLGGSRGNIWFSARNLVVVMVLAGLWHGASWNFVLWGLYHGILLAVYHGLAHRKQPADPGCGPGPVSRTRQFIKVVIFFHLVCFGWLLFRADTMHQVALMSRALLFHFGAWKWASVLFLISHAALLWLVQCFEARKGDLLLILRTNAGVQFVFYGILLFSILFYGVLNHEAFIYFQF